MCEEGETIRDLWVTGTQLARTQASDSIAVGLGLPSFGLSSCEIEYELLWCKHCVKTLAIPMGCSVASFNGKGGWGK